MLFLFWIDLKSDKKIELSFPMDLKSRLLFQRLTSFVQNFGTLKEAVCIPFILHHDHIDTDMLAMA